MKRHLSFLLLIAVAAFVAVGCGKFGTIDTGGDPTTKTDDKKRGTVTTKPFDAAAKKKYGCGEPEEFADAGHQHVQTGEKVKFKDNPPSSGNHWSYEKAPRPYGVYETKIPAEQFVHNLEHGHLVIVYDGLTKKEKKTVLAQRKKAPYHVLVTPRPSNPKKGVYYLGWRLRIYCKHPSAQAMQYAIDNFIDQGRELIMSDPPAKPDDDVK